MHKWKPWEASTRICILILLHAQTCSKSVHTYYGHADLLCQHICGAQWQVSLQQILQNSPIRWIAGISSGCHYGILWVETAVSVHWGAATVCWGIYHSTLEYNNDCYLFNALYYLMQLNYLLWRTLQPVASINVAFPVHVNDLQNYTQFAGKISHVFVSYHLMIQYWQYDWLWDMFQLTQDAQPHIFILIASHKMETFIFCAVSKSPSTSNKQDFRNM